MDEGFSRREALLIAVAIALLFTLGTLGFMWTLDEAWHEALYRTIVTASLTGLDSTPHGIKAEILTIGVVLAGVAIFGYFAAQVFDAIAHGVLGGAWHEKRRRKMIERLHDHIIVCGYGRVGSIAAAELRASDVPFVVLDFSEEAKRIAGENGDTLVEGNGAVDGDLIRAGIDRARGMIVASDDDGDNMFITLSAKARRPELTVIARASNLEAERKLRIAGADRVVTPYTSAGRVMASLIVKPHVASFVNDLTSAGSAVSLEEIEVTSSCQAVGATLGELEVAERTGAYIVAVRKADGSLEVRPGKDSRLEVSDVVFGIGSAEEIQQLEELFRPRGAHE